MNTLLRDRKLCLRNSTVTLWVPDPHLNVSHQVPSVHDSQAPNSVHGAVGKTTVNSEVESADMLSTFGPALACVKGPSRLCHKTTALYLVVAICRLFTVLHVCLQ